MALCQRDNFIAMGMKKTVAAHQESVCPLLNKVRKGCLDLAWAACIGKQQAHSKSTRRDFHLFRFGLGKNWVGRVPQVSDLAGGTN